MRTEHSRYLVVRKSPQPRKSRHKRPELGVCREPQAAIVRVKTHRLQQLRSVKGLGFCI